MTTLAAFVQGDGDWWWTRFLYQRSLALIYLIGFIAVVNQFRPLLGERGLEPAPRFLRHVTFRQSPSLFHLRANDRVFAVAGWIGIGLSLFALVGASDAFGMAVSVTTWALLWVLYLSFVNVGQTFYSFGWESILLEAGFFGIFLGSSDTTAPQVVIWMLQWLVFRVMFGAGLIKLRADPCWRKLTALCTHYETQPIPNPLSRSFHDMPRWFHRLCTAFTLFVELVIPLFYFGPSPAREIAGALTILFQVILIASGNLSWLNYLTIVITIPCFAVAAPHPVTAPISGPWAIALLVLTAATAAMSYFPIRNMLSRRQRMNASFNPFHLVGTYGAFGAVDRERLEVIVEGSDSFSGPWHPYEFKAKPGDPRRRPRVVSPYHLRLDWLMWFLPKSDALMHPWFFSFLAKLLEGDRATLRLIAHAPFTEPPRYLRARVFRYQFAPRGSDSYWERTDLGLYVPPLTLDPETGKLAVIVSDEREIENRL